MGDIIYTVTATFQIFVFLITGYYLVLGFFGVYRKKDIKDYTPNNKFAMIVSAHDEEIVIGNLIESMQKQDYPKELYDIYVIADNCTDKTAEIAKGYNVTVCERNVDDKRGKGYALEWMFEKLFKMDKSYDSIAIFDADNLVHSDFLKEINSKMNQGYKVVQGYIDSKNPNDSWIATSYSIAFWSQNRLFQLSRNNIGLSNQIGGTGFSIATETLKELGWGATCLTEDLEFTCKIVLSGQKVGLAYDAKIYDEKPLKLKQSWIQRRRWMQGFTDVASRYCLKLMKKAVKERKWYIFDAALYVLQPFVTLLIGVAAVLTIIQAYAPSGDHIFIVSDLFSNVGFQIFALVQFIITPVILILDKKISKGFFAMMVLFSSNIIIMPLIIKGQSGMFMIGANFAFYATFLLATLIILGKKSVIFFIRFLLYSIYTVTWIPITIQGILRKNNKEWNPTKHVRNVEVYDVN
ncbi:glycosyltransferase family 2 protein [Clostridium vincentii]|uniref:Beta-monoglucosyldiacylglycerol synthase n=1 Tax=Clostridium vincentii TaxID=52704 RepID=A0A2T0BG07_9CLOT|nr:glycosyltransferase family 2 protein [Clostridium vincentii]PRR82809.1 Beta-monoglucosyldiacylglycerol synthase [Clostridium vincentii]